MEEWSKDRLWTRDMPFKLNGIPVGARMTVIRLDNGKLLIHSPIQLTTALQLELSQLGAIQAIVTPNMNHHLFLSEWCSPTLKLIFLHRLDFRPNEQTSPLTMLSVHIARKYGSTNCTRHY